MRLSLKQMLGLVAVAAILCFVAAGVLRMRATGYWGYGKLGVTDGFPDSALYFIEVRGVGDRPTFARIVRFEDHSQAPENVLEIAHAVSGEMDVYTQNAARWNRQCVLLAGRSNDEKVVIPLEMATAQQLFARPGNQLDNYGAFEKLWNDYVAAHLQPRP
jgi:hypothetical protein